MMNSVTSRVENQQGLMLESLEELACGLRNLNTSRVLNFGNDGSCEVVTEADNLALEVGARGLGSSTA